MRIEHDLLGELEVPDEVYWGIHTQRALSNFTVSGTRVHPSLIRALGAVKEACALANQELGFLEKPLAEAIIEAASEIRSGLWQEHFPLDAIQGGAGTSTNMNVNEVIANRALELLRHERGRYDLVSPHDHVNLHQSTNDIYPSALRVAAIWLLQPLTDSIAHLQNALQQQEQACAGVLKLGRTQLQDAVPVTLGQEFSAWAQAVGRDRWRLYKVEERLRQVSLGGTAVGTGLNAPLQFIYLAAEKLRQTAGSGIARAENMIDAIQNQDVFVEVSGLLKAAAVNLMKIAGDLRLLSSGPVGGLAEIRLPAVQAGSSIMPGKINPVIPEMAGQVAIRVLANDLAITTAASQGQLELNPFIPTIAHHLLDSLEVMTNGTDIFTALCIRGIEADAERCRDLLSRSAGLVTALTPYIGYEAAQQVVGQARQEGRRIDQVVLELGLMSEEELHAVLDPREMTRPGVAGSRVLGTARGKTIRQD
jgi:aspartate ammonia-lyase